MAFSLPQVESKAQFSPLPHLDIEQGHLDKFDTENIHEEGFESSWDFFVTSMRLAVIGLLLSMLVIYVKHLDEHSDPIQHKFFANLLRISPSGISDGESSASHNVNLIPVNVMNDPMEAALTYEENENLELCDLFESECWEAALTYKVNDRLEESTTEREREQPIVNDTVIQDNAEE